VDPNIVFRRKSGIVLGEIGKKKQFPGPPVNFPHRKEI
jgi:hypothetical protein